MDIKVLGNCCGNCNATLALIEQVARANDVLVTLHKVVEMREIVGYGVMSTPGVVIDGKVVHAGGIPGRDKIERWLAEWRTAQDRAAAPADNDVVERETR